MRKKYYVLGALFLILIIVIVVIVSISSSPKLKQVAIYKASATASNIQFPYLADLHTIDYFTGSCFAAYNTQSGTTSSISPQFALPTIDAVRWSKSGVLFQASNYSQADDLYSVLVNNQVNTSQEYWWQYSFATQKVSLLLPSSPSVQNIDDAFWNNDGSGYAYIDSNDNIYLSGDQNKVVYNAPASSKIIQFSGNILTLNEGSTIKQVHLGSGRTNIIVSVKQHIMAAYVSPDYKTIAYAQGSSNGRGNIDYSGDLYRIDPVSGKPVKLLAGFNGIISGSGGDLYVGYADSIGAIYLNLYPKTGKASTFMLGAVLDRQSTLANILPDGAGIIYLNSSRHHLVRATTAAKNTPNPINLDYQIQSDLYLDGFEIHYFPDNDSYEIDIDKNPFDQYQNAALEYIKSKNIDPNQIDITWRANDGVNSINPYVVRTPQPDYATDPASNFKQD